jgi:hypothetical protein
MTGKNPPKSRTKERRLQLDAGLLARLVRAVRGWMRRPVGLYRLNGRWRAGLMERRRAPGDALALRGMLDDLQERLLAQDPTFATDLLGQLLQVHDEMRLKGWAGVVALPEAVRSKALFQAQMLARSAPSTAMTQLIGRLRASQAVATSPERVPALARDGNSARAESALEVSEGSSDEFEASQRGWLDTVAPLQTPAGASATAKERSP